MKQESQMKQLTQKQLKELLYYNPDIGIFIWRKARNQNVKKGDIAGTIQDKTYIQIRVNSKKYYAHRLAFLYMTGVMPDEQVDHINHNGMDNRWSNIREVTARENGKNRSKSIRNTSGATGISWSKKASGWQVQIMVDGIAKNLGYFAEKEDAIQARQEAETKYGFHKNHGS